MFLLCCRASTKLRIKWSWIPSLNCDKHMHKMNWLPHLLILRFCVLQCCALSPFISRESIQWRSRWIQVSPVRRILMPKTIGKRKGDCAWSCSRWQTQPGKICKLQRTNQCCPQPHFPPQRFGLKEVWLGTFHSLRTLYWFVLCNLQIFSGCICHVHLEQLHAQSPFLFPIVFGIILISFLDICSAFAVPSPQLFAYAALLGPLHGQISCCLWLWQLGFGVLLRDATSNLPYSGSPRPNALSSRSVLHDGRKHKTVVFSHALRWYARRTNLPLLATGCRRC